MARPGFVLEVDERTPPLLVPDGPRLRQEHVPLGAEVIYPPDPPAAVDGLVAAVDEACARPVDSDPLSDRLRPGMRLTVAFDDLSSPGVRLRSPDVRGRIIERVLSLAAAAGVDDVVLINAIGLNRRNTEAELRHLLGERVFRSFFADGRLVQHDAEDGENLRTVAAGDDHGPELAVNSRVADSDLLIMVHLVEAPGQGGLATVSRGLGSRQTISAELSLAAITSSSVAEPGEAPGSEEPAGQSATARAAAAIGPAVPVFTIEAVLTTQRFTGALDFVGRREWEWGLPAQGGFQALRRGLTLAPGRWADRWAGGREAGYVVSQVTAGDPTAVDRISQQRIREEQLVEVSGQADVLVLGASDPTAYSIDSLTNPVLAAWNALAVGYGSTTGTPLVRRGGAVIFYHPLRQDFSSLHHPSYVDFFSSVLSTSTDPAVLAGDFETKFAEDPWWRHLYRTSQAFHGVHPFHRWYQISPALQNCGDLVVVGGHRKTAARLGLRAASTLADALEIVAASVGTTPRIRYLHTPPRLLADVR